MQSKKSTFYLIFFIMDFFFISVCHAGDQAALRSIGFAPGGDYFAFEQYGIQDGSGFAYSDIFIIETATDNWVPDSPIRVELEDKTLPIAREQSIKQAAVILKKYQITNDTQPLINHSTLNGQREIEQFFFKASDSYLYSINLKQWEIENSNCQEHQVTAKLFSLSINSSDKNQKSGVLHKDSRLPGSRGCPMEYAIQQVFISNQNKAKPRAIAVIVSVFTRGFEGRNKRFIAITSRLN